MTDVEYPEHEKLSKISKESQAIGEFLEWAQLKGARLMHWWEQDVEETCSGDMFSPCVGGKRGTYTSIDEDTVAVATERDCRACGGAGTVTHHREEYRELWPHLTDALAEYFEIDQNKIEAEKRRMLEKMQEAHRDRA